MSYVSYYKVPENMFILPTYNMDTENLTNQRFVGDLRSLTDLDELKCHIDYVKNIKKANIKPSRSGVIVYTMYKHKMYFGLGVDNNTGDLTDFAGGVAYKKRNENCITGGLREHKEESLGIFGDISSDEIDRCLAVYNSTTLIIFIPLKIDIPSKHLEFLKRVKRCPNPEVADIRFFNKRQFLDLITSPTNEGPEDKKIMYHRIKHLLQAGYTQHNFIRLL